MKPPERRSPPRATAGEGEGRDRAEYTPDPFEVLLDPDGPTSRCLLCKAPSAARGVMVPHDAQLWGAPAGKDRLIGYGVCGACIARPDLTDAVEERIFGCLARGAA